MANLNLLLQLIHLVVIKHFEFFRNSVIVLLRSLGMCIYLMVNSLSQLPSQLLASCSKREVATSGTLSLSLFADLTRVFRELTAEEANNLKHVILFTLGES